MPDAVFDALISYSRQDQEFVRRLSAALQTRHIRTWVDWEGIPLSSKWLAEIEAQIEAANTFVFVVSPDSVASEICRAEIRHAAAYRKKIIPIVSRSVDPNTTPAEIVEWQWLFFREQDDFDSACDDLAEAMTAFAGPAGPLFGVSVPVAPVRCAAGVPVALPRAVAWAVGG